jgi:hypothetical protein
MQRWPPSTSRATLGIQKSARFGKHSCAIFVEYGQPARGACQSTKSFGTVSVFRRGFLVGNRLPAIPLPQLGHHVFGSSLGSGGSGNSQSRTSNYFSLFGWHELRSIS